MAESVHRDRNLVFAIFAVQIRNVSPAKIVEAAAAWMVAPEKSIADRLCEMGLLTEKDCDLLDRLVQETIDAHEGDAAAALTTLGGADRIEHTFSGSIRMTPGGGIETAMMRSDALVLEPDFFKAVLETPGRYSRISEHARGGFGRVLLVHDQHLGREIALKELLLPHGAQTPGNTPVSHILDITARFLQEARITGQLEHPSIVPVYELGRRVDGTLYYTMKLVRGHTLFRRIREAKDLQERLQLLPHFLDICNAIGYAHNRGVIHRDIKPENVMVGHFGETVVLDWGIAKAIGHKDANEERLRESLRLLQISEDVVSTNTSDGMAMGTPHYMPPEQAEGRLEAIDQRSDVYSLGALLYEILTGHPPFDGKTYPEIMRKVISQPVTPVLSREPGAPPELAVIAEKALRKDPAQRYQSARDIAGEVQRFMSGALVQAYTYRFSEHLRRYYTRHRAVLNTAAAAAALLLVLAIYAYLSILQANRNERAQHAIAIEERDKAQTAEATARTAQTQEAQAREEAESNAYLAQIRLLKQYVDNRQFTAANKLVWEIPEKHRNWEWGYLLNLCNQDIHSIRSDPPGVVGFALYSPDGSSIFTLGGNYDIFRWDASNGAEQGSYKSRAPNSYAFHPSGELLAVGGIISGLDLIAVEDMSLKVKLTGHQGPVNSVEFARDGLSLLSAGDDGTVRRWSSADGASLAVFQPGLGALWRASEDKTGKRVLVQAKDQRWMVLEGSSGNAICRGTGTQAIFSEDGSVIGAIRDNVVALVSSETGVEVAHIAGHVQPVKAFHFFHASQRIVTGSADGTARLWDYTGKPLGTMHHYDPVAIVDVSPDDSRILTASSNGILKLWHPGSKSPYLTYTGPPIYSAKFHPTEPKILTANEGPAAYEWDALRSPAYSTLAVHSKRIEDIDPIPQVAGWASTSADGTCLLASMTDHNSPLLFGSASIGGQMDVDAADDGNSLAMLLDPYAALVVQVAMPNKPLMLPSHDAPMSAVLFFPARQMIVTGLASGHLIVWDTATGKKLHEITAGKAVTCLAANPSNSLLAVSTLGAVSVWDTASWTQIATTSDDEFNSVRLYFTDENVVIRDNGEGLTQWQLTGKNLTPQWSQAIQGRKGISTDKKRMISVTPEGGSIVDLTRGVEIVQLPIQSNTADVAQWISDTTLVSGDTAGTLYFLESVPLTTEGGTPLDSASHEAKREKVRKLQHDIPVDSIAQHYFAADFLVQESLGEALVSASESDASGITPAMLASGMGQLGFMPGDQVLQLNGADTSSDTSRVLIQKFQQALPPGSEGIQFVLSRGGNTITRTLVPLYTQSLLEEITMSRATLQDALQGLLTNMSANAQDLWSYNQRKAAQHGINLAQGQLHGFWLPPMDSRGQGLYEQMRLAAEINVSAIDGKPIESMTGLEAALTELVQKLASQGAPPLELIVNKGEFIRITYRYMPEG